MGWPVCILSTSEPENGKNGSEVIRIAIFEIQTYILMQIYLKTCDSLLKRCRNDHLILFFRRSLTTASLDAVSSYLVDLQSLAGTETSSGLLMANFKSLQAKLERLV